jgi:hypothetical protein
MLKYDANNAGDLIKRIQTGGIPDYQAYYWNKLKKALQVHTEGRLFDKVITVFRNEDPESSTFVLNTYESVTKGSIWRGIDNLSRIFNSTGFDITGDPSTIQALSEQDFFGGYVNDFINISTARDPNAVQVWIKNDQGEWVSRFVETQFILLINDNEIAFIDHTHSEYEIQVDRSRIGSVTNNYQDHRKVTNSYYEGTVYTFGKRVRYIYVNREQYVEADYNNEQAEIRIETFPEPLARPYTYTGVERIEKGVHNSAVAGFIPFGNHALIQHRTYRSVEAIFGYPRMSEVELPCDQCVRGQVSCTPCEEFPEGLKPCSDCNGSGYLSLQSPFKIYKRKLFPDAPELNANIRPVEFFTPDIGILNYNADAWRKTLQLGEDAIYIQQRVETGNVESAASREKTMESMYAWLGRISSVIYSNIQQALDNYSAITGVGQIVVNRPVSFAIMSEIEAFQYLNTIVTTDAPTFIKSTHIENFLNKYVSKTNPIIKVVDVLKRVDPFVFYTVADLKALSDAGVISDFDWRTHAYAYPLMMQMVTREPDLLMRDVTDLDPMLTAEIAKKQPITSAAEIRAAVLPTQQPQ